MTASNVTPFQYLGLSGLRWTAGSSVFDVLPENGAHLLRWTHAGRAIVHWPDTPPTGLPTDSPATADRIPDTYGGNPILFPFPARCFDQDEPLFWRAPDGRRLPMPLHGIALRGRFELLAQDEQGFTTVLIPDESARAAYPFDYVFSVTYRFSEEGFACSLVLENRGTAPIPWCAGHHFYFALPLAPDMALGEHRIHLSATKSSRCGLATGGTLVDEAAFAATTPLDDPRLAEAIIHRGLCSNEAVLDTPLGDAGPAIIVRHGRDTVPPAAHAFVTWSPSPEAPFYCVEPWMGPANAPGHGVGLHWVPAGRRQSHTVEVLIRNFPS